MKVIKFMGGAEKVIEDDEAENVGRLWVEDASQPIRLRDGSVLNPKAIAYIDEPPKKAYWSVYEVQENKNGKFINREGEQCYLSPENIKEITLRNEYDQTKLLQEGV